MKKLKYDHTEQCEWAIMSICSASFSLLLFIEMFCLCDQHFWFVIVDHKIALKLRFVSKAEYCLLAVNELLILYKCSGILGFSLLYKSK